MKQHAAELLADFSGMELEIHEDYSGKAMYGKTTTGVVGSQGAFNAALAEFIREACDQGPEDCEDVADALRNIRQDSMGLDKIWY